MKSKEILTILVLALSLMVWSAAVSNAAPMGTPWTYQGRIFDANMPADGPYDLQFALFTDPILSGSQIGPTVEVNDIDVIDGYITVELDFGSSVFNGDARWLEIGIRPWDSDERHTPLSPRQEVTPTPYALHTRGIFVDDSGNVGIGTKFPNKKLTVALGDFVVYPGHEASIITDGFNVKLGDPEGAGNQVFLEIDDITEKFIFNNGNVGIGTVNPTRDLHIYRDAGPAQVGIVTADTSSKAQVIFGDGGGNKWTISSDNTDNNKLHFRSGQASGTPRVTLQQDGKVGIGTTNPQAGLHIKGNGWPNSFMYLEGNAGKDAGIRLYDGAKAKWHMFNHATQDALWIYNSDASHTVFYAEQSSGNVGIGTASPATKLHVAGMARVEAVQITGADVAEKFPVSEEVKPGMVVTIDTENPGQLCLSRGEYNRCVAGVVSGANSLPTGAILGNLPGHEDAVPIALNGRVWVYCDSTEKAIGPGDLLTTSLRAGHAMAVTDYTKAHGAVLGKAMTSLEKGQTGLVLTLINLQ